MLEDKHLRWKTAWWGSSVVSSKVVSRQRGEKNSSWNRIDDYPYLRTLVSNTEMRPYSTYPIARPIGYYDRSVRSLRFLPRGEIRSRTALSWWDVRLHYHSINQRQICCIACPDLCISYLHPIPSGEHNLKLRVFHENPLPRPFPFHFFHSILPFHSTCLVPLQRNHAEATRIWTRTIAGRMALLPTSHHPRCTTSLWRLRRCSRQDFLR